ncbi:MAG: hypothetical protein OXE73_09405 [Gammaproteobacteria bacterium]|nr:hypothetical protein [Gammaproteobacteria bacterium]
MKNSPLSTLLRTTATSCLLALGLTVAASAFAPVAAPALDAVTDGTTSAELTAQTRTRSGGGDVSARNPFWKKLLEIILGSAIWEKIKDLWDEIKNLDCEEIQEIIEGIDLGCGCQVGCWNWDDH